jgi:hypothetical protein
MKTVYELVADEAWTHGGPNRRRYWCFFGGLFARQSVVDRLSTALRDSKSRSGLRGEIKWKKVNENNIDAYKDFIDVTVDGIRTMEMAYRQMFLDRTYVWVPKDGESPLNDIDVQFKLYYQYIKHAFGIRYLPIVKNHSHHIMIRLDNHSSQEHKHDLERFVLELPKIIERPDIDFKLAFINSSHSVALQACDLLMGAAGSYGNKMHDLRTDGKRGMSKKQAVRLDLARHIYQHLRALDSDFRGSRAFNWFETTGTDGDPRNYHDHKMRIWKFKPKRYVLDRGWLNRNLDARGNYVRPDYADGTLPLDDRIMQYLE